MSIKKNKNLKITGMEAEPVGKKTPEEKVEATAADEIVKTLSVAEEELETIAQTKQGIDFSKKEELEKYGLDVLGDVDGMKNKVSEFAPKLNEEVIPITSKIGDFMNRLLSVGGDKSQRDSIRIEWENFIEESGGKLDSIISEGEELGNSNMMLLERLEVAVESGRQAIEEERDKLKKMKFLDRVKKWKSLREMQDNINQFVNRVKELGEGGLQAVVNAAQVNAVKDAAQATKQKMRDIQHTITLLRHQEEQLESLTEKKS